jgi:fumarate hydratase class II
MNSTVIEVKAQSIRKESDSLGEVEVPSDRLWGPRRKDHSNTSISERT